MKLPKKIKVGNTEYTVNKVKHLDHRGAVGGTWYKQKVIEVATHSNISNQRFKQEDIYDTFWHELTHAILKDMGSKLEGNEKFVTNFSERLNKAILSARF